MTAYGISEISVIPVRKEAKETSEMISQLLFGETFLILEKNDPWCYIKITNDKYEGWIDLKSISFITEEEFNEILNHSEIVNQKLHTIIFNHKNEQILLSAGATLPFYKKSNKSFKIGKNEYHANEEVTAENTDIISLSRSFINCPYTWGGKNPFGIDCSGFTQVIYKMLDMKLPRDAHQQVKEGKTVNFISDVKPGDLAFFDNEEGHITHVGILISNAEIIHASGKVRIDKFDQQGIYNTEFKKYTHQLRVIKRII